MMGKICRRKRTVVEVAEENSSRERREARGAEGRGGRERGGGGAPVKYQRFSAEVSGALLE